LTKKCEIDDFDLTAHANREDLIEFVGKADPHTILLGHGEEESRKWFEAEIRRLHPKMKIIQPTPGLDVKA
jgi:Cft2 family RNA processing exonuclease